MIYVLHKNRSQNHELFIRVWSRSQDHAGKPTGYGLLGHGSCFKASYKREAAAFTISVTDSEIWESQKTLSKFNLFSSFILISPKLTAWIAKINAWLWTWYKMIFLPQEQHYSGGIQHGVCKRWRRADLGSAFLELEMLARPLIWHLWSLSKIPNRPRHISALRACVFSNWKHCNSAKRNKLNIKNVTTYVFLNANLKQTETVKRLRRAEVNNVKYRMWHALLRRHDWGSDFTQIMENITWWSASNRRQGPGLSAS